MAARCHCTDVVIQCPVDELIKIYICHCTECRRQSGSAFGMSLVFPRFDFFQGQREKLGEYVRVTTSGKLKRCYFCKSCGSRLVHAPDRDPYVIVKAGCLAELSKDMMAEAVHIWSKEAVMDIPAGCEAYEEEPPDR